MKQILLSISVTSAILIGVSGCGGVSPTMEYAKKNNLDENIYSRTEIFGIGSEPINKEEFRKILKSETDILFDSYYSKLCRIGRNQAQFSECMQMKKASFTNLYNVDNKTSLSIVTVVSVVRQMIDEQNLMDIYIDNNILSYKNTGSHPFANNNKSILLNSITKYVNSRKNFSFSVGVPPVK